MAIKQAQMETLLGRFKKALNIENWTIELLVLDDTSYAEAHGTDFAYDTNGCTEINDRDDRAKIFLKASLTKEEAYDTLLHECIHLVTNHYDSFVRDTIQYVDSKKMKKYMAKEALWKMEVAVMRWTIIVKGLLK